DLRRTGRDYTNINRAAEDLGAGASAVAAAVAVASQQQQLPSQHASVGVQPLSNTMTISQRGASAPLGSCATSSGIIGGSSNSVSCTGISEKQIFHPYPNNNTSLAPGSGSGSSSGPASFLAAGLTALGNSATTLMHSGHSAGNNGGSSNNSSSGHLSLFSRLTSSGNSKLARQ
ncbi:unnamed protein product, partial [Protopolystoma xenopodis]